MTPPPGPFRPAFWRSPLRGAWLTSMLGSILLVLVGDRRGDRLPLPRRLPAGPRRATRSSTRTSRSRRSSTGRPARPGSTRSPRACTSTSGSSRSRSLLAKLWSVIPRLFAWPPVRRAGGGDRAASIALLVASTDLPVRHRHREHPVLVRLRLRLRRRRTTTRAVVFVAALARAPRRKLPVVAARLRTRRCAAARTSRDRAADRRPRAAPDPPTISRRGLLAARRRRLGARCSSRTPGESIGGPLREIAFLAPAARRAASRSTRPRRAPRSTEAMVGAGLPARAARRARRELELTPRGAARAAPGHAHAHARLRRGLVDAAGRGPASRCASSRGCAGVPDPQRAARRARCSRRASCARRRSRPARSPTPARCSRCRSTARTCRWTTATRRGSSSPALPGVHNTKWVGRMEFRA